MNEPLIRFQDVSKRYGSVLAVDGMSFEVQRGEILGLLGPNGSGKTTSIRLMNGVLSPDSGSISVFGMDPTSQGNLVRVRSGVLTETANLYENLTVADNLTFFARLYNVPEADIPGRIDTLLQQFSLTEKRKAKVGALSTGLKKRAAVAKALIHNPDLLFLDEPTSGLDPEAAREMIERIRTLNAAGVTVFVCTHNLAEAEQFCTRFVFLDRGRILEAGTLEELERKYVAEIVLRLEMPASAVPEFPSGVPGEAVHGGFTVKLPGKASIPAFLRQICARQDIYGATIENSNLEALYFEIRRVKP